MCVRAYVRVCFAFVSRWNSDQPVAFSVLPVVSTTPAPFIRRRPHVIVLQRLVAVSFVTCIDASCVDGVAASGEREERESERGSLSRRFTVCVRLVFV